VTGHLCQQLLALRLSSDALLANNIEADAFCEGHIFAKKFTDSETSFVENLLRLEEKNYLNILIAINEKPLRCVKLQKIKDEQELDQILQNL